MLYPAFIVIYFLDSTQTDYTSYICYYKWDPCKYTGNLPIHCISVIPNPHMQISSIQFGYCQFLQLSLLPSLWYASIYSISCHFILCTLQWSFQVAFGAASVLHTLRYSLINNFNIKWTDALETVYKVSCKLSIVELSEILLYTCYCSSDRVYSASHQLCYGRYSTDDFTGYLSVRSGISARHVCMFNCIIIGHCAKDKCILIDQSKLCYLHMNQACRHIQSYSAKPLAIMTTYIQICIP